MSRGGFRPVPECTPGQTPHRRYDIDKAILHQLKPHPKTLSRLWRDLNPTMRRVWRWTPEGWKRILLNQHVTRATLRRHLAYLLRENLISAWLQLKLLLRDHSQTAWLVRFYSLRKPEGGAPPPRSPQNRLKPVSVIHNPFHGAEGAAKFCRWLATPEFQA
jgi:hypothetical protein